MGTKERDELWSTKEVAWTEKNYTPDVLLKEFANEFPIIVKVADGYYGQDDIETLASDQVLRIHASDSQRRVLARDQRGRYLSIPGDYPIKFEVIDKKGKRGKAKKLAEVIRKYHLPTRVRFDRNTSWRFKVGSKVYTSHNFGEMELRQDYIEKFLKGNAIHDGIINTKMLMIPMYLDVQLKVAKGLRNRSADDFKAFKDMYSRAVSHVKFDKVKGTKDIMLYSDIIDDKPTLVLDRPPSSVSSATSTSYVGHHSDTLSKDGEVRMYPNWTLVLNVKKNKKQTEESSVQGGTLTSETLLSEQSLPTTSRKGSLSSRSDSEDTVVTNTTHGSAVQNIVRLNLNEGEHTGTRHRNVSVVNTKTKDTVDHLKPPGSPKHGKHVAVMNGDVTGMQDGRPFSYLDPNNEGLSGRRTRSKSVERLHKENRDKRREEEIAHKVHSHQHKRSRSIESLHSEPVDAYRYRREKGHKGASITQVRVEHEGSQTLPRATHDRSTDGPWSFRKGFKSISYGELPKATLSYNPNYGMRVMRGDRSETSFGSLTRLPYSYSLSSQDINYNTISTHPSHDSSWLETPSWNYRAQPVVQFRNTPQTLQSGQTQSGPHLGYTQPVLQKSPGTHGGKSVTYANVDPAGTPRPRRHSFSMNDVKDGHDRSYATFTSMGNADTLRRADNGNSSPDGYVTARMKTARSDPSGNFAFTAPGNPNLFIHTSPRKNTVMDETVVYSTMPNSTARKVYHAPGAYSNQSSPNQSMTDGGVSRYDQRYNTVSSGRPYFTNISSLNTQRQSGSILRNPTPGMMVSPGGNIHYQGAIPPQGRSSGVGETKDMRTGYTAQGVSGISPHADQNTVNRIHQIQMNGGFNWTVPDDTYIAPPPYASLGQYTKPYNIQQAPNVFQTASGGTLLSASPRPGHIQVYSTGPSLHSPNYATSDLRETSSSWTSHITPQTQNDISRTIMNTDDVPPLVKPAPNTVVYSSATQNAPVPKKFVLSVSVEDVRADVQGLERGGRRVSVSSVASASPGQSLELPGDSMVQKEVMQDDVVTLRLTNDINEQNISEGATAAVMSDAKEVHVNTIQQAQTSAAYANDTPYIPFPAAAAGSQENMQSSQIQTTTVTTFQDDMMQDAFVDRPASRSSSSTMSDSLQHNQSERIVNMTSSASRDKSVVEEEHRRAAPPPPVPVSSTETVISKEITVNGPTSPAYLNELKTHLAKTETIVTSEKVESKALVQETISSSQSSSMREVKNETVTAQVPASEFLTIPPVTGQSKSKSDDKKDEPVRSLRQMYARQRAPIPESMKADGVVTAPISTITTTTDTTQQKIADISDEDPMASIRDLDNYLKSVSPDPDTQSNHSYSSRASSKYFYLTEEVTGL